MEQLNKRLKKIQNDADFGKAEQPKWRDAILFRLKKWARKLENAPKPENGIKDMENFEKKMQDEIDDLHRSNNKNLIAKGLVKLHDWAKRLNEKYKETKVSGPKTAIKKALSWITGAIASLTRRLHNLTTKKENAIND